MEIIKYTPGTRLVGESCIALGFFDGVHEGHRRLLLSARENARRLGLTFTVFTFSTPPHSKSGGLIYPTEEKIKIFESLGADALVFADFLSIAHLSAEEFVKDTLYDELMCRFAVAGEDFRFAKNREGDVAVLSSILSSLGAEVYIEPEYRAGGEKVSSTRIKELLSLGELEAANSLLGAPYRQRCRVEHGVGLGKKLGFPTVNTELDESFAIPRSGVYRTAVEIRGRLYTGVTNVGTCPTFGDREMHAETYVVDLDSEIYGEEIVVYYLGFLREEKRFSSAQELIMQINVDKNRAIKENGDLKWLETGLN